MTVVDAERERSAILQREREAQLEALARELRAMLRSGHYPYATVTGWKLHRTDRTCGNWAAYTDLDALQNGPQLQLYTARQAASLVDAGLIEFCGHCCAGH